MHSLLALLLIPALGLAADYDSVLVRGEGFVKAAPDRVNVQLSVFAKAKDGKTAQEKNAKEMARVRKILSAEFSVPDSDVQTSQFNLFPEYSYEHDKQIFKGYQANHALSVRLKKMDQVGPMLDKLVNAKSAEDVGLQFSQITFELSEKKAFERQSLQKAMDDAKARAAALAEFSGRKIKGVRKISDSQVNTNIRMPQMPMMSLKGAAEDSSAATQMAPGEVEVSSQVSVEYELQ